MMGVERQPVLSHRKPGVGKSYPVQIPQTSDEFDLPKLGLQWQWHANHSDDACSLTARPGCLRLPAKFVDKGDFMNAPNLLLQKLPAESFIVEAKLDASALKPGETAGMVMMGLKHAALGVRRTDTGYALIYLVNNEEKGRVSCTQSVTLRVEMQKGGLCRFADFQPEFQAVEGRWIGAKVGLFCMTANEGQEAGHADFDYFRFTSVPK